MIDFLNKFLLASIFITFLIFIKAKKSNNASYNCAVAIALVTALIMSWMNYDVGIIGSENNPINMMYGGVLAVGGIGALIARFQPHGMARAMFATAFTMMLIAAVALIAVKAQASVTPVQRFLELHVFFAALWLWSAWFFKKAARKPMPAS
jgi:hypothetical protein